MVDPNNPVPTTGPAAYSLAARSDVRGGQYGIDYNNLDASAGSALWLGGMPTIDTVDNRVIALTGFSADPSNPFDTSNTSSRTVPLFDFDLKRLQLSDPTRPPEPLQDHLLAAQWQEHKLPLRLFQVQLLPGRCFLERDPQVPNDPARRPKAKFWPVDPLSGNQVTNPIIQPMVKPYYDGQLALGSTWTNAGVFWVNPPRFRSFLPGSTGNTGAAAPLRSPPTCS